MKLPLSVILSATFLACLAPASPLPGQVSDEAAKPVRQRFVPAATASSQGASFSALHHLPVDAPGVTMLMAHAGVGESFPVHEGKGPKLFEVLIAAGDDDLLKLEVRRTDGVAKHDLERDGTVWTQVAGEWFSLSYPSVTVSSKNNLTSAQAMLIVRRFGK